MSERRFTIRWQPKYGNLAGQYVVSIPNYDGGEVVAAEDFDALRQQLAGAVAALRKIATSPPTKPGQPRDRAHARMAEIAQEALDRLGGQ
jgi:hypothetical protein